MNREQAITATAFIHRTNKGTIELFAPKRASSKKFLPDKFELPGGHVEWGEEIEKGLVREIQEEFHVGIEVEYPFYVFTYINHATGTHSVEVVYFATIQPKEQEIKLNSHDHSEYRWAPREEALTLWDQEDNEYLAVERGFNIVQQSFTSENPR
ncbi:MAG: NUDIX hydrolase [Candidatus Roizmanbacteria bacterium]|nr:NUDIX hydrolase [Candidatus Roizmanbacteria bacterium]